jgi:hypothetical protein
MSDSLTRFMAAIRSVESGGNYKILGPPTDYGRASGAYQFIDSTWGGYKGYRSAYLAPPSVQDARARALMSEYYREFRRWDLVAVAWHGGRGSALRAQRDPAYLRQINDGHISTAVYVDRVMGRMKQGSSPSRPRNTSPGGDLRPWRVPRNVTGKAGKIVINPGLLLQISKQLTEHLATVDKVLHKCRGAAADVGKLPAGPVSKKLKHALDEALDDWEGLKRLPDLLSRDIGFVVEARSRALKADDSGNARAKQTIERLISTVGGTHTRSHVARMLRNLYRPDTGPGGRRPAAPSPSGPRDRPSGLRGVDVGRAWGGSKSVFDQFVTPFLKDRGLAAGSQKRPYDTVGGPGMSDHYTGNGSAYAVDYPTYSGVDDARALAKAMGISNWQPDSYASHVVRIDGKDFRVQILWGSKIDHGDHVHVGIRRA